MTEDQRFRLAMLCQGMEEITLGDGKLCDIDLAELKDRATEVLQILSDAEVDDVSKR